ncbi:D-alanyl-D-alanine carboxypeptidase (penicillin-binding protein 5/6) [Sinorhizobium fredii]|uniref:serine-type D-Ala-D-Ala carboxypeptidase n=1 Tax=Sinorhizobium fredii (strain USDA 257) TaxID=1185652 RepID=I3X9N0_SINF2|nr:MULTISPECIES: D-alanyl-D-alanine carboxypeptidase family protein [Sinorhizobium]AFL52586.1 D-alanyl-D-alanine carboxypeptidase DacD [Sinorhizobium fredii USDA 257]PDT84372.1 D-alanyl-D-alanine carboxypeptidase [Sinorhizobium sp. BJ1]
MRMKWFAIVGILAAIAQGEAAAQTPAFDTKAKQIYLIDAETGTVLFARGEDEPVPPASLAKLMAMEVVFEALDKGELTPETVFPVSEHAWRTGGAPSGTSTMFAAIKSQIRVADLVQGAIVHLANDACIILAEGLAGSEAAFAERMTARARELGMPVATFKNATGLPDPGNRITMRELVALSRHLREAHTDFYRLYAQPEFEWNKILQRNKNPLIAANVGVDGLATGFAEGFGFSLAASMQRGDRRVYLAMGGLETDKERTEESRRVLDWAMTNFEKRRIFSNGETIGEASVYGGAASRVSLVAAGPVDLLLPVNNPERLTARIVYKWPLAAPVAAGQQVGVVKLWNGDKLLREVPVKTAEAVEPGTLTSRALDALQELLFFWL